jgi:uncharacterized protein (DUF302 family)
VELVSVPTAKSLDDAITATEAALQARKFSVLYHLDINEKLVEKGLPPVPPFHILEVCSAPRAREALSLNQEVGYFLPCKVVVYEDAASHRTIIGLEPPSLIPELLQDPALDSLAHEVEDLLHAAILEAAGEPA